MRLLRRIHFIPNLVFCQYDFGQIQLLGGFFDALNKTGVSFLVEMRIGRKSGVRRDAQDAVFLQIVYIRAILPIDPERNAVFL